MNLIDLAKEIEDFPHFREFCCSSCGKTVRQHSLEIYAICDNCKTEPKTRAFGSIGTELEDIFDAILHWLAEDENAQNILEKYRKYKEENKSEN